MINYSTKFDEHKGELIRLREEGYGYKRIANKLDVSLSTIKRWCKQLGIDGYLGKNKEKAEPTGKGCLECSNPIVAVNHYAKFCSKKCRNKHHSRTREREKSPMVNRTCKVCDESFETNILNKVCCSQRCRRENYLVEPLEKTCKNCGTSYIGTKKGTDYCSSVCSYEYGYKEVKKKWPVYEKRCIECGKHYSTTAEKSNYCSSECSKRFNSSECSKRFNNRKAEVNRREQLKKNGKIDWDISIERLIKRDGSKCYLCGERCSLNDYEVRGDDTFIAGGSYPSIEHVIPVSKGGTHTWCNVKLAHRRCNAIKSDKLINIKRNSGSCFCI